jgi:tetratricopeptide (TPR) repeat protein
MFSPVVNDIVRQEMQKEANDLEKRISSLETELQRASKHESSHSQWTASYEHWDNFQDTDELTVALESAKSNLARLKERIKKLGNCDTLKTCSHRHACSCSGNKQTEREVVSMTTSQRIEEMESFKEKGNALFAERKYKEALALYEKSLIFFEYCFDGTEEERRQADNLRLLCQLNAAACFLELKLYSKCIEYCSETLKIDGNSVKALFRRARALRMMDKFHDAQIDLMKAKQIVLRETDLAQVERELELLKVSQQDYDATFRQFAQKAMR